MTPMDLGDWALAVFILVLMAIPFWLILNFTFAIKNPFRTSMQKTGGKQ